MKKIMVKYTMEVPEERLDKYCRIVRTGRREATERFKQMAETYGRISVYEVIDETINSK